MKEKEGKRGGGGRKERGGREKGKKGRKERKKMCERKIFHIEQI